MTKTIIIKCPCGEIFRKENIPVNSSKRKASFSCKKCKAKVNYEISNGKVSTCKK